MPAHSTRPDPAPREVQPTVADAPPAARRRPRPGLAGLIVAVATLALLVATEPRLSIVWDEGYTLGREARVRSWFRALADPPAFARTWTPPPREMVLDGVVRPSPEELDRLPKLFRLRVLVYFWPFAREEPHGHPPFYAIVGMIGDVLAPGLPVLPRARLGTMLAFSLTAGAIASFMARRWGAWAALAAAGGFVLQPRLFAHAHYAAYDAILTCLWVGAVLAFWRTVEPGPDRRAERWPRWGWVAVFGVLCGWAADTKLTGWFLPLPFLAWAALYRDRRALLTLVVGGVIAACVLYAFNPPWWPAPLRGMDVFFGSNLTRGLTAPIQSAYLGKMYRTPNMSLPWHNTLVWTLFVTPAGLLLLALTCVPRALRRARSEPFGLLVVGHWAFLLILRALPHTPGHDGERLFLPAFGLLALAAGLGARSWIDRFGRFGQALAVVAVAESAVGLALIMPTPLSYYSPLVGGLPGATAAGMEPTYYWDALDYPTIAWLNDHTPPDAKVKFATEPRSWMYLQDRGIFRRGVYRDEPGYYAWYVVQNRPGNLSPLDRHLIRHATPARVVVRQGVPLLWVFPYADAIAWQDAQGAGR